MKAYWKNIVGKYGLYDHLHLSHEVVQAKWIAEQQIWRVDIRDMRSGLIQVQYANVVISAIGIVHAPNHPEELQGLQDTFKGDHFHSARWRHDISLHNKRVAVIGNGCSA